MCKTKQLIALTLLASIASEAAAHSFGAHGAGFAAGFFHPFLGIDHLLAMVAIGLWASKIGGRALWAMPLSFVSMMAAGAGLAMASVTIPHVEAGIATSVLVLGLVLASSNRLPLMAGVMLSGLFALFHGHAHGTEIPQAASPWLYALGFTCTTLLLQASGLTSGKLLDIRMPKLLQTCGLAIAFTGAYLLTGA